MRAGYWRAYWEEEFFTHYKNDLKAHTMSGDASADLQSRSGVALDISIKLCTQLGSNSKMLTADRHVKSSSVSNIEGPQCESGYPVRRGWSRLASRSSIRDTVNMNALPIYSSRLTVTAHSSMAHGQLVAAADDRTVLSLFYWCTVI